LLSVSSLISIPALAVGQEATDTAAADDPAAAKPAAEESKVDESAAAAASDAQPASAKASAAAPDLTATPEGNSHAHHTPAEPETAPPQHDWQLEVHGYFRAPMSLGFSSRPNPDTPDGPAKGQISYGPNRVVDSSYYSFAYTRLQEQDWAEVTFHLKKKHVDAAVGWMGYWLAATGFRNPDAAAVPGVASLTLDTDVNVGSIKGNVALQMGAWWPGFGYFEKYDTFTK